MQVIEKVARKSALLKEKEMSTTESDLNQSSVEQETEDINENSDNDEEANRFCTFFRFPSLMHSS